MPRSANNRFAEIRFSRSDFNSEYFFARDLVKLIIINHKAPYTILPEASSPGSGKGFYGSILGPDELTDEDTSLIGSD